MFFLCVYFYVHGFDIVYLCIHRKFKKIILLIYNLVFLIFIFTYFLGGIFIY